jgi:molybdopterin synthase catalytic subunit
VSRDHDGGRTVTTLEYEGHLSAETVLREVAEGVAADPAVVAIAVSHRVGVNRRRRRAALAAAVSTAHRAEAFAPARSSTRKKRLPIWKARSGDGTDE